MKIKTLKTIMTKNMNKLETAITTFEKVETEGGSATKIKRKAEELLKLQKNVLQAHKKIVAAT